MIEKKKVLVCIDWFLPGFRAGGPVSSCAGLVEHLSADFDFYIICRDTDYTESNPYPNIKANRWLKRAEGVHVLYISKDRLSVSTLCALFDEVKPQHVYLNSMFSFWFTMIPLWICKNTGINVVLASRGMLAPSALAVKSMKKRMFLLTAKLFNVFNRVTFQASTSLEMKHIRAILPRANVKVAPNLPRITKVLNEPKIHAPKHGLRLLNIARIAPEKNVLGALKVLMSIDTPLTFDFYGPIYDEAYWLQCKQQMEILPSHIQVNYRGAIEPHAIAKTLVEHHFLFMPTFGENFGHIIYESLHAGVPVIISDRTPWVGLAEKQAGWDLPLDNPAAFKQVLQQCASMDSETYVQLQTGARKTAQAFMDKSEAVALNKALFS